MRVLGLLCTVTVLAVLAACGTPAGTSPSPGAPTGTSDQPGATTAPVSPAAADELTVTVQDASGKVSTTRLTCSPPGGTHPDPAAACAALAKNAAALRPVPKDRVCTQIYGGSATATITGTWDAQPVFSRLSLINGCEISRWKALEGLLPPAGA